MSEKSKLTMTSQTSSEVSDSSSCASTPSECLPANPSDDDNNRTVVTSGESHMKQLQRANKLNTSESRRASEVENIEGATGEVTTTATIWYKDGQDLVADIEVTIPGRPDLKFIIKDCKPTMMK